MRGARRDFLVVLALACAPVLARAAQPGRKRLAILTPGDLKHAQELYGEMLRSLATRGYAQGGRLELLMSVGDGKRLVSEQAREVVAWRPDVIVADGSFATSAALAVTRSIPIVTSVADPVAIGFARSLSRPGGNVTGLSQGLPEVSIKVVEILKLLVPRVARVAIVHWDVPSVRTTMQSIAGHFERAARQAGIDSQVIGERDIPELVGVIRGLRARGIDAAIAIGLDGEDARAAAVEAIAARIPLVAGQDGTVDQGMLAAYSSEHAARGPRMAAIVEQLFAGADPGQIPFQSPERFRFSLNRRTAKALGIAVTPELLLRADRVID